MTAVIVRLAISDRENKSLLEQVRTDSLTGLSNRGRMEVDLKETCEQATLERPAMLFLFDLNGFKRYNDTFRHPAGDELLKHLGHALSDAVGKGYKDAAHMKKDKDLDPLRDREDFQKLLAQLEARPAEKPLLKP